MGSKLTIVAVQLLYVRVGSQSTAKASQQSQHLQRKAIDLVEIILKSALGPCREQYGLCCWYEVNRDAVLNVCAGEQRGLWLLQTLRWWWRG